MSSLVPARPAPADDWPNFRGPRHDGICRETGTLTRWPDGGPKHLWSREIGAGFSSFAVVDGRVFTCGTAEERQIIYCLDAETGTVVWKKAFEPQFTDPDPNLHGPRATPTVDAGRVYLMGAHAHVFCWDARSGDEIWQREFSGKPHWGYSGSVLIEGGRAIIEAGGEAGSLCALDKKTGKTVWICGDDPAAYATPYPFTFEGRRYVIGFMAQSFLIAEVETGRQVLRMEWPSHSGVNAASPIYHDGCIFVSTGYGYGAGVFRLTRDGDGLKAAEVWRHRKIRNKFQTPILLDGKLYTSDESALKCADFLTGETLWRESGVRHGTLLAVDGHLILLTEEGELQIAPASPEEWRPASRVRLFEGTSITAMNRLLRQRQGARCWTVPVLSGGRLYVRDHDTVVCLDLRRP